MLRIKLPSCIITRVFNPVSDGKRLTIPLLTAGVVDDRSCNHSTSECFRHQTCDPDSSLAQEACCSNLTVIFHPKVHLLCFSGIHHSNDTIASALCLTTERHLPNPLRPIKDYLAALPVLSAIINNTPQFCRNSPYNKPHCSRYITFQQYPKKPKQTSFAYHSWKHFNAYDFSVYATV